MSFTLMKGQRSFLKIVTKAKLITLSVQLIIPNYLVILSHQHSQHHGFFRNLLPYPLNLIFYLLLLLFKKQFDFLAICDQTHDVTCDATHDVTCDATHDATHDPPHVPILDPIHDLMQSDLVRSCFCQHCCGFHILVNPQPQLFLYVHLYLIIAVRFRC